MRTYIKITLFFICFIAFSQVSVAQVYLGGAGVISYFSPSGLDEYQGFAAIIQRQIYLNDSRFSLTPTLQGSLLNSRQYNQPYSEFYTSVTVGTHLNYDILSSEKFSITPFAGPSFIWITGTDGGVLALEPSPVNIYRLGLETGLSVTYVHSEHFSIKLIPLTYTWSDQDFRQGNVLSVLFQIK